MRFLAAGAKTMRPGLSAGLGGLLVLALLPATAIGQSGVTAPPLGQLQDPKPQVQRSKEAQPDPELQAIIDGASAVAPEFGADVMIRLAESGKVPNRGAKLDLLANAFYFAANVEQSIKRAGIPPFLSDTRSGHLAISFRLLNLDGLSLESRVVSDMLAFDSARARELLEQIRFPTLAPLSCEESLTYDPALFYETLGKVTRDGSTAKDKLKGRRVDLIMPYVSTLQSHAQVRPAARLLVSADLTPAEFAQLSDLFAGALSQLRGDERSFAAAARGSGEYNVATSVGNVITALDKKGLSSIALLKALRQYLVSNFNDLRCAETAVEEAKKDTLPETVTIFNREFRVAMQRAQIPPIRQEELNGAHIGPKFEDRKFWQSPASEQLLRNAQRLRFGDGQEPLTAAAKSTSAWSAQLTDFLTELEAWIPDGETAADYFVQKSILYEGLVDLIPTGPDRSKVIDSFVGFLEQNAVQTTTPIEWFLPVDHLLSGARAADDRDEVIHAFLNSRDSVLSLYARLERWDPRNKELVSKPTAGTGLK
jgi:hypothetical protein